MKYLFSIILLFITTSCFSVDQKLIDSAERYGAAVANLHKIFEAIKANTMPLDQFIEELHKTTDDSLSAEARVNAKNKINERHTILDKLNSQYAEAEVEVKRLEPLKKEYDKQKDIEFENKQFRITVLVVVTISLIFITFFGSIIWLAINRHKKYQQLLKDGKITQEEYDRVMKNHESKSMFSNDLGVNPSTGLPLIGNGVCDAGGNLRGSSPIRSSFDSSQDYRSRHRWD